MDQLFWNNRPVSLNGAILRRGANVNGIPVEITATARARWLAEVSDALQEAVRLLDQLECGGGDATLIAELQLRVAAAKSQVASLGAVRQARTEPDPLWINLGPWQKGERPSP